VRRNPNGGVNARLFCQLDEEEELVEEDVVK